MTTSGIAMPALSAPSRAMPALSVPSSSRAMPALRDWAAALALLGLVGLVHLAWFLAVFVLAGRI